MSHDTDSVEGYVIDVACIRKNSRSELLEKARTHSQECALMGHCLESGYGLVTEDDRLTLLDANATRKVVDTVEDSDTQQGIRLRAHREHDGTEMKTTTIEETS